jgi:hypothetical protein
VLQHGHSVAFGSSRRGWWRAAWLVAVASWFAFGVASSTLSVDVLVCSDGFIALPTVTTVPGTASALQLYDARIVSSTDRTATLTDRPTQGGFEKRFPTLDHLGTRSGGSRRFDVDWSTFSDPWLQVFANGDLIFETAIPAHEPVEFAGGDGTLASPYLVATARQLQQIACHPQGPSYYALTRDVDLAGRAFFPIGSGERPFSGGIDGRGRTIANLTIDRPGLDRIGFIALAAYAFVQDVHFDRPYVHGFAEVGIVVGRAEGSRGSVYRNVTIGNGVARGVRKVGGMLGYIEHGAIVGADVAARVFIDPPNYHGTEVALVFPLDDEEPFAVGGLVGEGEELSISAGRFDLTVTQSDRVDSAGAVRRVAGLVGYDDGFVQVTGIDARLAVDLTLRNTGSSDGAVAGVLSGDAHNSFIVDSNLEIDVVLRDDGRADGGTRRMEDVAAITSYATRFVIDRVRLSGRILLDTRPAVLPITVKNVGGAFGQVRNRSVAIHRSHVDVDIVILGDQAVVSRVGGVAGLVVRLAASDVRVGGGIRIDSPTATQVGGLFGFNDSQATQPEVVLGSVIHRGPAIAVAESATEVGTLWGNAWLAPFHGANVYWDSDRNGVTTFDPAALGRPATSRQLANLDWLTTTAAFDPATWCVVQEQGVAVPAVIFVTSACLNPPVLPDAPQNLTAAPGNARVTLVWNPPASDGGSPADVIVVQRRVVGSSSWVSLHPHGRCVPETLTCAVADGLTNGQAVDFRVAVQNVVGRGPWSNVVRATPGTTPAAPGALAAAAGDGVVTLTWSVPSDDGGHPISGYRVEMIGVLGGAWMPVEATACPSLAATCALVVNLSNGAVVAFRVAADNALGVGAWSPTATALPNRNPSAPTDLVATPGDGFVTLTWRAPTDLDGAVTYAVQISSDGGGTWSAIDGAPCDPAGFTCVVIPNLSNGAAYAFRVAAVTPAGVSPYAGLVVATPSAPADVPVITRTIAGPNRGWLIIASPSAATVGHELSLDDGATWASVTPHVGDRVFRVNGLANGATYPARLRAVRSDGSVSLPTITHVIMPTPIRIPANDLGYAPDPATLVVTGAPEDLLTIAIDVTITNRTLIQMHDMWLTWPDLPADTRIVAIEVVAGEGEWHLLDDWWYGENVEVPAGSTHRVRITLEARP